MKKISWTTKGRKEERAFFLVLLKLAPIKQPLQIWKWTRNLMLSLFQEFFGRQSTSPICMTAQMADVLVLSLMQKSSLGHWSLSLVCWFGKLVWGLVFACKKRGMRSKLINKIKRHLSTAFVFNFTLHPYARALHFHFRRTREVVSAFH